MHTKLLTTLLAGLLYMLPAHASGEAIRIGVGLHIFCGTDFEGSLRLPQTPYQVGFIYQSCTSHTTDPFSGHPLTDEVESSSGPFVNYLFSPDDKSTFYVGIAMFTWSRTETYLVANAPPGPPGSASTTDLYFGGGYTTDWGEFGYTNFGLYSSPTAKLETKTVGSSTTSSGGFGLQGRIGLRF